MYRVLILISLAGCALAQLARNNTCRPADIGGIVSLDLEKLLGKWYQIERIPNSQERGDCSTSVFTMTNTTGHVSNREVYNSTEWFRNGTISRSAADIAVGRFVVDYNDTILDYYVLSTDYTGHALLYACKDTSNTTSNVWAWKLSRNETLTASSQTAIATSLALHPEILSATWRATNTSACEINGSLALQAHPVIATLAILFLSKQLFAKSL